MAAGLGFKTFTTGEVLTAADTNGYLMQGVLVFASAAARDAAITSPQEGQFAYLKDTNVTTYYTGSAWANLDTTGMTNPMTTTGDMVYSSSGSTPARLGIGTTGQVVTVAGGVPTWATPAGGGGGMTSLATGTLSGSSVSLTSISQSYVHLQLIVREFYSSSGGIALQYNSRGANYARGLFTATNASTIVANTGQTSWASTMLAKTTAFDQQITINLFNYTVATRPGGNWTYIQNDGVYSEFAVLSSGYNEAITSLQIIPTAGTWSGGSYTLYGVK